MLRIGVAGLGGFATHITDELLAAGKNGTDVKLVAACDPRADAFPQRIELLRANNAVVLADYDALLQSEIDAVWLPLPIDLHRDYTERALKAGKGVIVEKPAAGSIDDVDAMIAARDAARLPVVVGFQNLADPAAWQAKQLLLDGIIGEVISATVLGCWPRGDVYYNRSKWAGRLRHNGVWVLDSPLNNAMAHFANLALFLLGPAPAISATPLAVEAELYRANPIENFDTCTIRADISAKVPLTIAMTHACKMQIDPFITITAAKGIARIHHGSQIEIVDLAGKTIEKLSTPTRAVVNILSGFAAYREGKPNPHIATLENARAHTLLVNGVAEAADVKTVPDSFISAGIDGAGAATRTIRDIETLLGRCVAEGKLLSELSSPPSWTAAGGRFELSNYRHFPVRLKP